MQQKSTKEKLGTPSNLPLDLLTMYKVVQMMSDEYTVRIPITLDLFSFPDDHIFVTKEDVIQFSRMKQIGAQTIAAYIKYVTNLIMFCYGQLKSMLY